LSAINSIVLFYCRLRLCACRDVGARTRPPWLSSAGMLQRVRVGCFISPWSVCGFSELLRSVTAAALDIISVIAGIYRRLIISPTSDE